MPHHRSGVLYQMYGTARSFKAGILMPIFSLPFGALRREEVVFRLQPQWLSSDILQEYFNMMLVTIQKGVCIGRRIPDLEEPTLQLADSPRSLSLTFSKSLLSLKAHGHHCQPTLRTAL